MDGGDKDIRLKFATIRSGQRPNASALRMDVGYFGVGQHFAAQLTDAPYQCIGKLFRRSLETGVTVGYEWGITDQWRVSLAGTVMYGMLYHLQTLTFSSKETQSRTFQVPYMEIGMLPRLTYSLTDYLSVGAGIGGFLRTSPLNEPKVFGPSRSYAISVNAGIRYRMWQHWYVEGIVLYNVFARTASPEYRGFLSPNGQVTATVGYEF